MRVPSKIKFRYWEKDYDTALCCFVSKGKLETFKHDHTISKEENIAKIMNIIRSKGYYCGKIEIIEEDLYLFKSKEGKYVYKIEEDNHE